MAVDCLSAALSAGAFTAALAGDNPDARVSIDRVTAITEMKKRLIVYDPIAAD
jgi:hypothetical protein